MSEPLKVGLVGTGSIAKFHLNAYNQYPQKMKLTAVCDIRRPEMEQFALKAGVSECYDDYFEMLRKADIEAVDICTIHDQHAAQVIAAAEAGKQILLEKPMGCSRAECEDMVRAARKAGVTFMVGHDLRYMPHTLAIKKAIDGGELGQVRLARCELFANMPESGVYRAGSWLNDPRRAGGGLMISGMIHQIDLLRYYIGDIRSVTAVNRSIHPQFQNGAEEYACAILEFENGVIADILLIGGSTRSPVGCRYTLYGDEGTIHSTQAENRHYQFGPGMIASRRRGSEGENFNLFSPLEPVREGLAGDDPFINEILHFVDCCREGREPLTSGRDNLGTINVIFAIYESIRSGQKVELSV